MTGSEWRGEQHRVLPRFYQRGLEVAAVRRPQTERAAAATPPTTESLSFVGREGELRGIPVIGRGVGGAIAGTNPLQAIAAKAERERRRRAEE